MIEGKIVNQSPKTRFNSGNPCVLCSKCRKIMEKPVSFARTVKGYNETSTLKNHVIYLYSYFGHPKYFIYESKSGYAVTYCSKYCRDKHNHRFTKKGNQ